MHFPLHLGSELTCCSPPPTCRFWGAMWSYLLGATAYWPRGSWVGGRDSTCHRQMNRETESERQEAEGREGIGKVVRTPRKERERDRNRKRDRAEDAGASGAQGSKHCLTDNARLWASLEEAGLVLRGSWCFLFNPCLPRSLRKLPHPFPPHQASHAHSSHPHSSAPDDP